MNKFDTQEQIEELAVDSVVPERDVYIDYRKVHYRSTIPDNRVLVFLTGFCVGMIFFYLTGGQNIGAGSLLDSEHLTLMQNLEVNRSGLFEYVISLRMKQLLFCVICSLSSVGSLMAYSIMGWCGFEAGLMIFSLVYQYGIKGIFLTFSMFLPHGVFYCILFLIVFRKHWESNKKSCHNEDTIKRKERNQKIETAKTIVLVLAVFVIGMLCEVYINPEIMRKMTLFF